MAAAGAAERLGLYRRPAASIVGIIGTQIHRNDRERRFAMKTNAILRSVLASWRGGCARSFLNKAASMVLWTLPNSTTWPMVDVMRGVICGRRSFRRPSLIYSQMPCSTSLYRMVFVLNNCSSPGEFKQSDGRRPQLCPCELRWEVPCREGVHGGHVDQQAR